MLKETYTEIVELLVNECKNYYSNRLVSFCLFGSVARDKMNYFSDIDFLLVVDPLPDGRMKRIEEFENIERRITAKIKELRKNNIYIELSPIIKTSGEVNNGSLIFLDMIEDGKLLFDKNDFLKNYLVSLKGKLKELGAKRVCKGDSWYWILKDPYNIREELIIY